MRFLIIAFSVLMLVSCQEPTKTQKPAESYLSPATRAYPITTAADTSLRLTLTDTLVFSNVGQPLETDVTIFVDPARTFQTIVGFGGALTDASAETFAKLPPARQEEFLRAYYDSAQGIGYTLARTHINSCDFSSASYTYVEEGDTALKSFSVEHDKQFRIPMIQRAIQTAGGSLTMFVSPWSPPAWMKDNGNMLKGGKLKPEYRQVWADYYVQFIKAYEKEGIPVWGLTVQNEPMAVQTWESCIYTAEEERDFIKSYLGPTLHRAGMADKKLIAWDHNRDLLYQRAMTVLQDEEASRYVWGIGFHWYEDWRGGQPMYDNVHRVHESWPDKALIFTEGCNAPFVSEKMNDWKLGEHYGESVIMDLNAGTSAWTDWNILLDERGGPNHVGNFCFAPVHADTRSGDVTYTPSYYFLGHFSKFIRPGAVRVQHSVSTSDLLATAFRNPDGSLAVVVMNAHDKAVTYQVWIENQAVAMSAAAHSISTILIR